MPSPRSFALTLHTFLVIEHILSAKRSKTVSCEGLWMATKLLQNAIDANMSRPVFPHESMNAEGVWSVWSSRSILVLLKWLFQIHHASLKNMSRLVTQKICWVRVPCISWNPHSNSISALLAVDTSPQNSHQKVGTRWPSNLAIRPWKFTESGLTQRKSQEI